MTWKGLVLGHASVGGVSEKVSHKMLRATFNVIAEKVLHGERVSIPGFGVFTLRKRKARRIRNPHTHEMMELPASQTIGFRCSKAIKR